MDYLSVDPRLDEHPDVLAAGFIGSTVFQVILRACAVFDKRGRLPSKFGPAWLARRLNIGEDDTSLPPETFVRIGIERCLSAGLLERDGEDIVIPGWERFYTASKGGAERTRAWRDKSKSVTGRDGCDGSDVGPSQPTLPVTACDARDGCDGSDATPHHSTPHNRTEASASQAKAEDGFALEAQKAGKSERKPSRQEKFAAWFESERKATLGDEWQSDKHLSASRLNRELAWIEAELPEVVAEAVGLYLADTRRRKQDPPCSLLWFSHDRAEYLSRARRGAA